MHSKHQLFNSKNPLLLLPFQPGKPVNEVKSHRLISLLPIISKLSDKLFTNRIMGVIEKKQLVAKHQFGFQNEQATVDQVYRIIIIKNNLKTYMLYTCAVLLEFYITQRTFRTKKKANNMNSK